VRKEVCLNLVVELIIVDKSDVLNGDEVAEHQYKPTVVVRQ